MVLPRLIDVYRKHPYRNIFLAMLVLLTVDALVPNAFTRSRFADATVALVLSAALLETVRTRQNAVAAVVFGLPAIGTRFAATLVPDSTSWNSAVLLLSAVFFAFMIWNLLHDLARDDRPTSERIYGALCAYIFIGILFALVYAHAEYRQPGSFDIPASIREGSDPSESMLVPVFTYYSFVTLTTLGYGDITPVADHARTLTWFEALVGQLYLAVMVASFVAVHIAERSRAVDRGDPP